MKIYLAIRYHSDNKNRKLIEEISSHLEAGGHEVICAVRDFESWGNNSFDPKELLLMSLRTIDSSDLVLIEATEKGMGVGIEAGYAFARSKPVMTITQDGSDLSINLQSLSSAMQVYEKVSEIKICWSVLVGPEFYDRLGATLHAQARPDLTIMSFEI